MESQPAKKSTVQKEQPKKQQNKLSTEEQKKRLEDMLYWRKHRLERSQKDEQELNKPHAFWDGQPVIHKNDKQVKPGAIEVKKVEDVRKEPYNLPEGYHWCEIDINNPVELSELYTLLTENYVEDDDSSFRFDYSREFLKWALTPPNYQKTWLVGVRGTNEKLYASITGVPVHTYVEDDKIKMAQINFLCVHKAIRQKRLAPMLIKQVTRRINLRDKWQAIYTAGKTLPTPFTQARYWHRSLNPKKLVDVKFSGLGINQTKGRLQKLYKLPEETTLQGLRPMNKKDVFTVTKLINQGLEKYVVKFRFTEEEVKHYFLPIPHVIYSYVIQKDKEVTDFLSFYSLPSHIMKHEKYNTLNACYSYYNFANTVKLEDLISNALILAKKENFDVYNCLDIMQNESVFKVLQGLIKDLLFMVGDGFLNYYLYNWNLNKGKITPSELAVVLV